MLRAVLTLGYVRLGFCLFNTYYELVLTRNDMVHVYRWMHRPMRFGLPLRIRVRLTSGRGMHAHAYGLRARAQLAARRYFG